MADLPELGIVTLLNSMLDNLEVVKFQKREAGQGQEGRKIDRIPMGEYTVEEGMKRIWAAVEDEDSPTQPCVCGATVKCTASLKEEEEVHIIKETEEMSIRVANRELLDDEDIRRECAFTGCKFSDDKMCTTEKEYIEGQKWQGVDKGIGNSPDMEGTAPQSYTLDVNESYMLCTHGPGLIYFADAGQRYVNAFLDAAEFMVVPEKIEWIPSQVMQLNGTSAEEKTLYEYIYGSESIVGLNQKITDERLKWNQEKINKVWEKCEDFYDEYGVKIDPRMVLAIVIAEGTGSFNTNSTDKAGDGGNGPQSDFEADCENAIDLLGGKILAYLQYHEAFTKKVEEAIDQNLSGMEAIKEALKNPQNDAPVIDVLYYLNWETPRLGFINKPEFKSGVYADNNRWSSNVRDIYSDITDFDAFRKTGKYTEYLTGLDPAIFSGVAADKNIDVNRSVEFKIVQNGMDSYRQSNGEYTVVGIIGS